MPKPRLSDIPKGERLKMIRGLLELARQDKEEKEKYQRSMVYWKQKAIDMEIERGKDVEDLEQKLHNTRGTLELSIKACNSYQQKSRELEERVHELEIDMKAIICNDKTKEYPYPTGQPVKRTNGIYPQSCRNNLGMLPEKGSRWLTPKEIARKAIGNTL